MIIKLAQPQAVGDIVVFTSVIRDIHKAYPDAEIVVSVSHPDVFTNNPHVRLESGRGFYQCSYDTASSMMGGAFCHAFHNSIESRYSITIPRGFPKPWLFPSEEPRNKRLLGLGRYVIINAGYKTDAPTKHWGVDNYQTLVSMLPDVTFVQVGRSIDKHRDLKGNNVISLIDQVTVHDLIWLIHNSVGVISPVSAAMNIAGAFDKPCVCLAGGREPPTWYLYKNLYYFFTGDKACWQKDLRVACRKNERLGTEMIASCMAMIKPEFIAKFVEEIWDGNDRIDDRQIIDMQYTPLAPRRSEARQIAVRCGTLECCRHGFSGKQPTQLPNRRDRLRIVRGDKAGEGEAGTESQALLASPVGRPVGNRIRGRLMPQEVIMLQGPKPVPSWKRPRHSKDTTKPTRMRVEHYPDLPNVLYVGSDMGVPEGDYLGDSITQVMAASIYWRNIRPDSTVLSLKYGNPLNFLWDGFSRDSRATVVYDHFEDVRGKFKILDERLRNREVQGIKFRYYFEPFRCMDRFLRGNRKPDGERSIIDIYLQNQEYPLNCDWGFDCNAFDLPKWKRAEKKTVWVSPLEKCANNMTFTYPFYRAVIEGLIKNGVKVVLNDSSCFCRDLVGDYLEKTFLPFKEMLSQMAEASIVVSGNSGPLWASAVTHTPLVLCETPTTPMDMYHSLRNNLSNIIAVQRTANEDELLEKLVFHIGAGIEAEVGV